MQLIQTAPGCKYSIVARVDTTIYSPEQTWTLDVPAGQHAFIAETDEIIIPGDALICQKKHQVTEDLARVNIPGSGSLATFVTRAIEQIVGKGNVTVAYGDGKLTGVLASSVTTAQTNEVKSLLKRVLPSNVVTEMERENGIPLDYTPVEYLKGGTSSNTWIDTKITPIQRMGVAVSAGRGSYGCGGAQQTTSNRISIPQANSANRSYAWFGSTVLLKTSGSGFILEEAPYEAELNWLNSREAKLDISETGEHYSVTLPNNSNSISKSFYLFKVNGGTGGGTAVLFSAKMSVEQRIIRNYIPALDPTGAPCMYDLVSKTPFYNKGTGDFLYPGEETKATTYSLRDRMYAQCTEHGIRRLYHVPEGYNGSKEEYAEENGFKLLIETPMPEEGYWEPVWHDREDCIELEWVEIEPPTEEVTEND